METLQESIQKIAQDQVQKVIVSKPMATAAYKKIVIEAKGNGYQVASYTEKQVFHQNIASQQLAELCRSLMETDYRQLNGWSDRWEHMLMISKKGVCSYKRRQLAGKGSDTGHGVQLSHNRKKQYLLEEGTVIAPLVDMGIFTREGKVVHAMYDKYKQINRFLEILDDEIGQLEQEVIHMIDFGCGKSYLTFVIYYYLTEIRKKKVEMIGLDLKEAVIEKCNQAAQKYGFDGLRFEMGDINGYQAPFPVDIVITLHACDTATDYALYNAIQWKAKMIFSVPCCQHELNQQMAPESLALLGRYGILKERFAALATDAIRGNLLEYSGYKTQLLEFIDFAHTPKNILIRAVRRPITTRGVKLRAIHEVHSVMDEFHFNPTLYRLLNLSREAESALQREQANGQREL